MEDMLERVLLHAFFALKMKQKGVEFSDVRKEFESEVEDFLEKCVQSPAYVDVFVEVCNAFRVAYVLVKEKLDYINKYDEWIQKG